MKIAHKLTIISSLLLIAGCSSWRERHATYDTRQQYSTYGDTTMGTASSSSAPSTYQRSSSTTSTYQPSGTSGYQGGFSQGTTASSTQSGGESAMISQVRQQLNQDPALAAVVPNLQISFQNGTLTLAGTVSSEQEKQKIESIVKSTTGVFTVNNQLQVSAQSQFNQSEPTANQAVGGTSDQSSQSSATQTSQVPASSPSDPSSLNRSQSQDQTLSPTSNRGDTNRIYRGADASKDTTSSSSTAQADTTSSTGQGSAFSVNINGLTEADRTLGQQIIQEVRTDTSLAGLLSTTQFNIENGKVTLRGTVKSEDEKKKMESAVQRVTGVSNIDNQLQVSSTSTQSGGGSNNQ